MAAKMATVVGDVTGPPAAPPSIKYTSSPKEDQRLFTEGKIVSKYCNISKTLGGVHPPSPRPLVPCTTVGVCICMYVRGLRISKHWSYLSRKFQLVASYILVPIAGVTLRVVFLLFLPCFQLLSRLVLTLETSEMSAIFVFTTKTTQPRPQVFSVNGALTCKKAALLTSSVH